MQFGQLSHISSRERPCPIVDRNDRGIRIIEIRFRSFCLLSGLRIELPPLITLSAVSVNTERKFAIVRISRESHTF